MGNGRKFRFGVQGRATTSRSDWLRLVQNIEDKGYSTYVVLDHFVRGYDPLAILGAAAIATSTLRIGTMVIDNDFRHPAILAKSLATIDVLSEGRLEIGIGAGWLKEEYDQSGIPFNSPGARIAHLVETIEFMKRAFTQERVSYTGASFTITDLVLPPKPVQQPCPPILIGGGGKRILKIAAEMADIVGFTSRSLPDGSKVPGDMTAESVDQKVAWMKQAAGERFPELELTSFASEVILTNDRAGTAEEYGSKIGLTRDEVLESPHLLIGTIDQMVEDLQYRRDRFGISYFVVEEGNVDSFAPIVARLSGT